MGAAADPPSPAAWFGAGLTGNDQGAVAPRPPCLLEVGLTACSSWVDMHFQRCFLVMETSERALINHRTAQGRDLLDREIIPVMTSWRAASAAIAPRL